MPILVIIATGFGTVFVLGITSIIINAYYVVKFFASGDYYGVGAAVFLLALSAIVSRDFLGRLREAIVMIRRKQQDRLEWHRR